MKKKKMKKKRHHQLYFHGYGGFQCKAHSSSTLSVIRHRSTLMLPSFYIAHIFSDCPVFCHTIAISFFFPRPSLILLFKFSVSPSPHILGVNYKHRIYTFWFAPSLLTHACFHLCAWGIRIAVAMAMAILYNSAAARMMSSRPY